MTMYDTSRMTPRMQRCLEAADAFAENYGHDYIGTEHIVMGILADEEAVPSGITEQMGVRGMLLYQLHHFQETGRLSESVPRLIPENPVPTAEESSSGE